MIVMETLKNHYLNPERRADIKFLVTIRMSYIFENFSFLVSVLFILFLPNITEV